MAHEQAARSRRSLRTGLGIALLAALLTMPQRARADDAAEARLHFELGGVEFRARHYPEALTHFLAANRLAPTANTVFNLAQTYLAMGRNLEAYRFFRDYQARAGATPGNLALAAAAVARIEPTVARIEVEADPPGATIFIDRTDVGDLGVAPRTLAVEPGPHTVIVQHPGYREARVQLEVARGAVARAAPVLVQVRGTLRVHATPPGALVVIDEAGSAMPAPLERALAPGVHRVRLRAPGYLDVAREVEVRPDDTVVLEERLAVDVARTALLSVTSTPPGALVQWSGRPLGPTPLTTVLPTTGVGEVTVTRAGSTPWRRIALLRPGRETRITVALGRAGASRPFWVPAATIVGSGLVAAGAVTGLLALLAHQDFDSSPDRASLDRTSALNVAADVTMLTGVAVLATGVLGYFFVPDPSRSRASVREEGTRVFER